MPSIAWIFLGVSLIGAALTWNVQRPIYAPSRRAVASFFAGWLTGELALHHIAWQAAATVVFIALGALMAWPGWLGLLVTFASWAALIGTWRSARSVRDVFEQALRSAFGERYVDRLAPDIAGRMATPVAWRRIAVPFPIRHPEVERVKNVVYARAGKAALHLDVYRHRNRPVGCPVLLQVHGGAWIIGNKNQQGLPLMLHLASQGWVCVSINYRLSPRATFPDHLIDVKRALAWVRTEGARYGADPDFIVITGGSAGGHLATLAALTANDPEYQPGFEHVDTSVRGCVPFYGVYDFTDRFNLQRHSGLARLLERRVMKAKLADAPEAYEKASPIARVHPDAPPFLVIHGDRDTLAPVEEARRFVEALRARSRAPVVYVEVPGAQHAFEIFPSLRCALVLHGVERFLALLHGAYRAKSATDGADPDDSAASRGEMEDRCASG